MIELILQRNQTRRTQEAERQNKLWLWIACRDQSQCLGAKSELSMTPTVLLSLFTILEPLIQKHKKNKHTPLGFIESQRLIVHKNVYTCSLFLYQIRASLLHNQLAPRQHFDNKNPLPQSWCRMTCHACTPRLPMMHAVGSCGLKHG